MTILVAGIGNVFLGDDAFGVEVLRELVSRPLPPGVIAADFGIRGLDLGLALLGGHEAAILVDCTPRGGAPGSLYVLDPLAETRPAASDGHTMTPDLALAWAREQAGPPGLPGRVRIVGCEPASFEPAAELTGPVRAAIPGAIELVERLLRELID